jgi:hypothetical protein
LAANTNSQHITECAAKQTASITTIVSANCGAFVSTIVCTVDSAIGTTQLFAVETAHQPTHWTAYWTSIITAIRTALCAAHLESPNKSTVQSALQKAHDLETHSRWRD